MLLAFANSDIQLLTPAFSLVLPHALLRESKEHVSLRTPLAQHDIQLSSLRATKVSCSSRIRRRHLSFMNKGNVARERSGFQSRRGGTPRLSEKMKQSYREKIAIQLKPRNRGTRYIYRTREPLASRLRRRPHIFASSTTHLFGLNFSFLIANKARHPHPFPQRASHATHKRSRRKTTRGSVIAGSGKEFPIRPMAGQR